MKIFVLLLAIFVLAASATAYKNEICGLTHSKTADEFGVSCRALHRRWTYKQDTNECIKFDYGGCNGNENNFKTQDACEEMCKE